MLTIAIANQKGGVGKTTTAVNLAYAFYQLGQRTLICDMDPQGSATLHCGFDHRGLTRDGLTLGPVLTGSPIRNVLLDMEKDGWLSLAAGGAGLGDAELYLSRQNKGSAALTKALQSVADGYDLAVIDCPPNFSLLTLNGLAAADWLLIPVQTEALAFDGLSTMLSHLQAFRETTEGSQIRLLGILPTLYDRKRALHRELFLQMSESFSDQCTVFPPISMSAVYPNSAAEGCITGKWRPNTPGLDVFQHIARDVLRRQKGAHHG